MQTPKARTGSSEAVIVPQKGSPPRGMRNLRPSSLYIDSASTLSRPHKTASKERSPKVIERRSPRSPAPERKRPSRIPELESQISRLREELKKVREQLSLSESRKKRIQKEAEDSKEQLFSLSAKLKGSQQQLLKLSATTEEEARVIEHEKVTQENERALELLNLKQNLSESLCLVENMKNQVMDCNDSSQGQDLVNETLRQLEAAKRTVEHLRADAAKSAQPYNNSTLELNQSRTWLNSLEEAERSEKGEGPNHSEEEINSLKSEVEKLRCGIETAEAKRHEEHIRSTVQIRNAYELMEQIKLDSTRKESVLEAELKRKKADIEELMANLIEKETELQHIVEENGKLNLKIEKNLSSQRELERLTECVAELKANLMDKETTLQSVTEENEMLKIEISKRHSLEVEAAKTAEHEAVTKLVIVMEEADRSDRKAARMAEELEAARAENSEMEAELRKSRVQSDQWRKAAETAVAVISAGNGNNLSERSMSLDNKYNKRVMNIKYSPFCEDIIDDDDDDLQRKTNGNMLKKIGVLWKKPQK